MLLRLLNRVFASPPSVRLMSSQSGAVQHTKVLIAGGGSGGCSVAHRFARKLGANQVTLIDPAKVHYYQPLWTLVGAGLKSMPQSSQSMKSVLPPGIHWLPTSVERFDPDNNTVYTADGGKVTYDYLVVALGLQLLFHKVDGLVEALKEDPTVCSNYSPDTVLKTFPAMQNFRGGNAVFTLPNTPIKCAGAPQKIMYLFEEYLTKHKIRDSATIQYFTALPVIFGVKKYADSLLKICEERKIQVNLRHHLVQVNHKEKKAVLENIDSKQLTTVNYSFLHATPPMGPWEVIQKSALADPTNGYVAADKHTLQHPRFPNVFSLGDSASLPTSKTAAAISSQSKVVYENLLSVIENKGKLQAKYDGYTSCPLVTASDKCILAEFDYSSQPLETCPWDQSRERYTSFMMKAHLMPQLYWYGLLKGYWNGPSQVRKILHLGMGK